MKKLLVSIFTLVLPVISFAALKDVNIGDKTPEIGQVSQAGGLESFLSWFKDLVSIYIIPIIITLALILFLWGLISYITAGSDEEKRGTARNYMIYGIIALFVMVSVWGLVAILNRTFGIGQGGTAAGIPEVINR